jgi:hypothetical protein
MVTVLPDHTEASDGSGVTDGFAAAPDPASAAGEATGAAGDAAGGAALAGDGAGGRPLGVLEAVFGAAVGDGLAGAAGEHATRVAETPRTKTNPVRRRARRFTSRYNLPLPIAGPLDERRPVSKYWVTIAARQSSPGAQQLLTFASKRSIRRWCRAAPDWVPSYPRPLAQIDSLALWPARVACYRPGIAPRTQRPCLPRLARS